MKPDQPSDLAFTCAAWTLDCDQKIIRAVSKVEAGPEGAFYDNGVPVLLFERHTFWRLTSGKFVHDAPDLCNPVPGSYGLSKEQPARMQRAALLDHDAAIMSASWGLFQIMGENFKKAGFHTLQSFVDAMYRSADAHLRAFVMFILADQFLVDAVRTKNWTEFALHYNGPAEKGYDTRLRTEYERL